MKRKLKTHIKQKLNKLKRIRKKRTHAYERGRVLGRVQSLPPPGARPARSI
jgi:hypothetical protein